MARAGLPQGMPATETTAKDEAFASPGGLAYDAR